eukprot:3504987-Prymnesium_polylepis.2
MTNAARSTSWQGTRTARSRSLHRTAQYAARGSAERSAPDATGAQQARSHMHANERARPQMRAVA